VTRETRPDLDLVLAAWYVIAAGAPSHDVIDCDQAERLRELRAALAKVREPAEETLGRIIDAARAIVQKPNGPAERRALDAALEAWTAKRPGNLPPPKELTKHYAWQDRADLK
jgi:hypothetical protein